MASNTKPASLPVHDAALPEGRTRFSAALNAEQIKLAYAQLPAGLLASVVNAPLVGIALWGVIPPLHIGVWLAALAALTVWRYLTLLHYRSNAADAAAADFWGGRFRAGAFLSGVLWGAAGLWLFPAHSDVHQILLGFVLGGMVAGGIATLSSLPRAYLLFMLPAVVPFVLRMLVFGGTLHVFMGLMATAFTAIMWVASGRVHATIKESLLLRFENLELVTDLNLAKSRLEGINRQLQEEVSERRSAEETIRQSQQRLALHVQQTPLAAIELDVDMRVVDWNPSAQKIFGFSRDEAMGRHPAEFILPASARPFVDEVWQELLAKKGSVLRTNANLTKDGRNIVCEWYNTPLVDEQGRVIGVASLGQDITERVEVERALKELNETLSLRIAEALAKNRDKDHLLIQQSRLAAMGEMVNNIAHQWRQPLSALSLVLANIKDEIDRDKPDKQGMEELMQHGYRLIDKMSSTIDDFRGFFRPNREKTHFSLVKAVADAVALVQSGFKHQNIEICCEEMQDVSANGYPNEFSQALLNLLNNAKDAIQQKRVAQGRVAIRVFSDGGRCLVEVSDNGGGIADEIIPKIFDPYFTSKDSGTGIGLYMSKMIMKNMGGSIEVRNGSEGAIFTLKAPATAVEKH